MKIIAMALLVSAILCNSVMVYAEDAIPFGALAKNGGIYPVAIPPPDKNDSAAANVTQTKQQNRMTTGGKVMTGVGIGFVAIGTVVFIAGATAINDSWFGDVAGPTMGVGAVLAGGGIGLIVLGDHRRTTK